MMRALLALCSLVAAAALAACSSVGPTQSRPASAVLDKPSARADFLGSTAAAYLREEPPAHWWRLYQSPTLDRLIEEALAANTELRIAAANIGRARAGLDYADAATRPTTTLSAAPSYGRRSAEEELRPGKAFSNNWVYGAGVSVSYQVDLFGQIKHAIEAAQADLGAAGAARDAVRVTVVAETTRAFLETCSLGREIGVAEQSLALQARSTALVQRLSQAGRGTATDVTRASAQEEQVRATLPTLRAQQRLALYRIAVLTGRTPAEFPQDVQGCAQEPRIAQALPVGDGAALLNRRPDLRRADFELRSTTARIGVATADLYPKVALGASLASVGLLKNVGNTDTFKFSLGPLISWQFPDRTRVHAQIHAIEAEQQAALARFDGIVLNALKETESALEVYARDLERRATLEKARDKARQAAADTERLFIAGRSGYLPVLDANRSLVGVEQSVAAADSKLAADQVNLFLALGGGWQE